MRDSELVLRFLAFDRGITDYRGDFKDFLDSTTRHYEEDWDNRIAEVMNGFKRLDLALRTTATVFGEGAFRKWLGDRYERVMNRAVFDCIARYFADADVAMLAANNPDAVVKEFRSVCNIEQFRAAIERSTKTVEATHVRLMLWGSQLASVVGKKIDQQTMRIV